MLKYKIMGLIFKILYHIQILTHRFSGLVVELDSVLHTDILKKHFLRFRGPKIGYVHRKFEINYVIQSPLLNYSVRNWKERKKKRYCSSSGSSSFQIGNAESLAEVNCSNTNASVEPATFNTASFVFKPRAH